MLPLLQRAQNFAERTAIVSNDQSYTYGHLLNESALAAGHLLGEREDLNEARVAFLVPPSYEYVVCQWAIWRAGGIAVPLCTAHPLPSLRYVLEDTGAEVLIVHPDYQQLLEGTAEELNIRMLVTTELAETSRLHPPLSIAPARGAQILYTSGTTSLPKGVVTTHANIEAQITTLVDAWEWSADDRILNTLPLHHVHGIINVLSCALWSGGCCVFLPKFDVHAVWEEIAGGEITRFMAVPTIYYKLIAHWEKLDESDQTRLSAGVNQLNLMISGSAALPVPTLERWREISGHTLLERYGMTEIGMGLSNSFRGERRPGYVGKPLPGVEIRLVDRGIQVKGPSVFLKYWNKPEATTAAFTEDGWFKTGDIAEFENGMYRILGRDSVDIIKSGGYKISALEIESVLLEHPVVNEVAVVGISDPEWGEVIAAGVVSEEEPDFADLTDWLRERIPAYRLPRRWLRLEELPRNTLGKVTKNELKKQF